MYTAILKFLTQFFDHVSADGKSYHIGLIFAILDKHITHTLLGRPVSASLPLRCTASWQCPGPCAASEVRQVGVPVASRKLGLRFFSASTGGQSVPQRVSTATLILTCAAAHTRYDSDTRPCD